MFRGAPINLTLFAVLFFMYYGLVHPQRLGVYIEDSLKEPAIDEPIQTEYGSDSMNVLLKTSSVYEYLVSVTCGNVDGDSGVETIALTQNNIYIYAGNRHTMPLERTIPDIKSKYCLGIDAADLNGNGIDEIFVSALGTQHSSISSMILEYDPSQDDFKILKKNIPLYFRVLNTGNAKKVVACQKYSPRGPFYGSIYKYQWTGNTYDTEDQIIKKADVNVLGLAIGTGGKDTYYGFNKIDRIVSLDKDGNTIMSSSQTFGGTRLYFESSHNSSRETEKVFFPMRLLALGSASQSALVVAKNNDASGNILKNLRRFTSGFVLFYDLTFQDHIQQRTPVSKGFIQDLYAGDCNNDGEDELVVIHISDQGTGFSFKPVSRLLIYSLR